MKSTLLVTPLASLLLLSIATGQTLHVSASLTTGTNDGSSWANAFQGSAGLRTALDVATPGEEIWITGGTYLPTDSSNRMIPFEIDTDGLIVRGGFAGTELTPLERPAPGAAQTVLSGDLAGNDDGTLAGAADNSYKVLSSSGDGLVLEDIHVRGGGRAMGTPPLPDSFFYSAALGYTTEITVRRCSFEGGFTGGLRVSSAGIPSNLAQRVRIEDCSFRHNSFAGFVGLALGGSEGVTIARCIAEGNDMGFYFNWYWSARLELINSIVAGNAAAGIYFHADEVQGSQALVRNCTVANNDAQGLVHVEGLIFGGSAPVIVQDSIVWGNHAIGVTQIEGLFGVRSCIVQGGLGGIVGGNVIGGPILDMDPAFRDPAGGDLSLLTSSPAIDLASGDGVGALELDFARQHRSVDVAGVGAPGVATDMGALELTGSVGEHGDCAPVANSTGQAGRMFAQGSTTVSANNLTLLAERLPLGQFGLFLTSQQRGLIPAAGGLGTLCLGGAIGRFNGPGQIQLTGPDGRAALGLDLGALPQPTALVAVQPGDTWRFQFWHRDIDPGGAATSQLSGTVAVGFD